jgi:hypothetical protein
MTSKEYEYDIALSFAGENRDVAEEIAEALEKNSVKVFYDKYEEHDLWGKDLYEDLSKVYSEEARYCIILISKHYIEKNWTRHERKNAQERAFEENKEYILPVRLDDTKVPGIRDTIGYLDFRQKGINGIVNAVLKKLNKKSPVEQDNSSPKTRYPVAKPRMPNIRKEFSDKQKEDFLYDAFSHIKEFIRTGLQQIESEHTAIETTYRNIHETKFIGKIFKHGKEIQAFKIWIGSGSFHNAICMGLGSFSIDNDGSMNEIIYVEESKNKLFLKITMGMMGLGNKSGLRSKEDTANYLWDRILQPLERG